MDQYAAFTQTYLPDAYSHSGPLSIINAECPFS